MKYKASVRVMLKPSVLDPQGGAVLRSLQSLGHSGIDSLRVGKLIEIILDDESEDKVRNKVASWADQLLANPIMENYTISLEPHS